MSEKCWKGLKWFLIIGTVLAAIKLIFVDYSMDEEYQIVMAYRRIRGDFLFKNMWEPHQTSAFACYYLLRLYSLFVKDFTGVVVFIRIITTLIQASLSVWLYLSLKKETKKEYAFLLALIYFNYIPKLILIPEFSNLQLWFFTALVLILMKDDHRILRVIAAGFFMSLEVLSYPSTLILFPVILAYLVIYAKGRKKLAEGLTFTGTCGVCGGVWLLYILSHATFDEFLRNVKYILDFDSTHNIDVSEMSNGKFKMLISESHDLILAIIITLVLSLSVYLIVKAVAKKKKSEKFMPFPVLCVFFSALVQLLFWTILQKGYEKPQIIIFSCILISICFLKKMFKDSVTRRYLPAVIGSYAVILAVLYMSDLGTCNALATGILCEIYALLLLVNNWDKETSDSAKTYLPAMLLLISLSFVSIFGKGFAVKYGRTPTNTILGIENVVRKGPAKYIFTHYMNSYILNQSYDEFLNTVPKGSNVLIVTDYLSGSGTTPYMFGDYNICHFSIVDPTTYDEKLLTYWELYPDKKPDVIVIDCWFGQPLLSDDAWIMQYIENDFGYTNAVDGTYVRFFLL